MIKDGMYCHPERTAGVLHEHDLTGRCTQCRDRTQWHTAEHAPLCLTCAGPLGCTLCAPVAPRTDRVWQS